MARFKDIPKRHPAKPGDLICAQVIADGGWLVLPVSDVDDDGYVAAVLDEKGRRTALNRVYPISSLEAPHLIIPEGSITPQGRREAVGLCGARLDDIKAELRQWKADA